VIFIKIIAIINNMKKIFFSTFLVFALVFSFGNPANAQVSSEQTLLQNLYQQLDAIRVQLGGLVSRESVRILAPTTITPSTANVVPCGLSGATWQQCANWCTEIMDGTPDSSGTTTNCLANVSVSTNVTPTARTVTPVVQTPATASMQDDRILPLSGVMNLQSLLNRMGFDSGVVDGKPGQRTVSAIRAFQAEYKFPVTGIANYTTLNQMNRVVYTQNAINQLITTNPVQPNVGRIYHCTISGRLINRKFDIDITTPNMPDDFGGTSAGHTVSCVRG
jgi:hypothetical protein